MKSSRNMALLLLGLAGSIWTAFQLQRGLSGLASAVLENYEISVPAWLRFALTYPLLAWGLPLLVLITWAGWPSEKWRGPAACALGLGMLACTILPFKLALTL